MLPIVLDMQTLPVTLIGNGGQAVKRLQMLLEAKVCQLRVFSPSASESMCDMGYPIIERLPTVNELGKIVFIVGLPSEQANTMFDLSRKVGALVNVEDVKSQCDFYMPSIVRRGDLCLSVSTSGASPSLGIKIKEFLEGKFGLEWAGYVEKISKYRKKLREDKLSMEEVKQRSDVFIEKQGWL